jgi:chromosome segregation ATPase
MGAPEIPSSESAHAAAHRALSISPKASDAVDPEMLASLIEKARDVGQRCDALLAQCQSHEQSVQQASCDLQERLQLGARMLKAFQTQINQIQALFSELQSRQQNAQSAEAQLRQRVAAFEADVDAANKRFDERVEQTMQAALARIEHAAATAINSRIDHDHASPHKAANGIDLTALSDLLQEAAQRISALASMEAAPTSPHTERAESVIEPKPKPMLAQTEAQSAPSLRLHA